MTFEAISENKENQLSIKREEFRIKTSRLAHSCPRQKTEKSQQCSQVATSRRSTVLSQSRNSSLRQRNYEFHEKRRQNQLNSMFRIRKQKLEAITKYNKQFYVKLNTQESHYTARQKSKQKDSNEKEIFTFRTVDSRQSRQILGPICNFNPIFSMNESKLSSRQNEEKENSSRAFETLNTSRNLKDSYAFLTPLRIKLGMKHNPQNQNIPLTQRSPKLQHLSHSMQYQSFLKTPQRLSKLPEIYSFF